MKKSLEETRAEFAAFMDNYVEGMKARHKKDMKKAKKDLLKLAALVLLAVIYATWIMPYLEEKLLGIKH